MKTFLCCSVVLLIGFSEGRDGGPLGEIKIHEFNKCEGQDDPKVKFVGSVRAISDDADAITVDVDIPFDCDNSWKLLISADKWVDDEWKEKVYEKEGDLMEFIDQFLPRIWENMRSTIEPNIEAANFIPKGRYILTDFQETYKNADVPQFLYGKFKAQFSLFRGEELIGCMEVLADSFENNDAGM